MSTATTARIRRCNRDVVYATAGDVGVLAARPDAKPQGRDEYTLDSFIDSVDDAQALINEKFAVLSSLRATEAAETDTPLGIGTDVPIAPVLPKARMIDASRGINKAMTIKGLAVDTHAERNSIEATG